MSKYRKEKIKLYRLTKSKRPTFKYYLLSTFEIGNEIFVIFAKYKKDKTPSSTFYNELSNYIINLKKFPFGDNYMLAHFNIETGKLLYDDIAKEKLDSAIFLATLMGEREKKATSISRNTYLYFIDDEIINKIRLSLKEDY